MGTNVLSYAKHFHFLCHATWLPCKNSIAVFYDFTKWPMERFHSRDQQPYWITETKERICIKIEFKSQRISLVQHHGRHSFVLEHQHGRCDVM